MINYLLPSQISLPDLTQRVLNAYDLNKNEQVEYTQAAEHVRVEQDSYEDEDGWTRYNSEVYRFDAFFRSADSNADGVATRSEITEALRAFDHDKNGQLDNPKVGLWGALFGPKVAPEAKELTRFLEAFPEEQIRAYDLGRNSGRSQASDPLIQRMFEAYDHNGNGEIQFGEVQSLEFLRIDTLGEDEVYTFANFFAAADGNADGKVTLAEASATVSRFDRNDNGKIDGGLLNPWSELWDFGRAYPETERTR